MSPSRTVRPTGLVGLILLAGCGGPSSPPAAQVPDKSTAKTASPVLAAPAGSPLADSATVTDAEAAAKSLLAAINQGTAAPAALTDPLKQQIAPPVMSADKERGFSEWAADGWLKGCQGRVSLGNVVAVPVGPVAVGVEAGPPAQGSAATGSVTRTLARLVKVGNDWRLDWLLVGPPAGPGLAGLPATAGPGRFTAVAFLAAVLAGDAVAAEPLLTARAKTALAPPLAGDPGYNRGTLRLKLRGLAGGATGYTVARAEADAITGELTGAGGPRPFALKLAAGPDGWRVDEFELR